MSVTTPIAPARSQFTRDRLFIGGEWVEPAGDARIDVVNPATEEVIGSIPEASPGDVDRAVAAASAALHGPWRAMTFRERAEALVRVADELDARADAINDAYVAEFGGLRRRDLGRAGAAVMREHLSIAEELSDEPELRVAGGVEALIVREPVGPVLAIVPWNSTYIISCVKIASALLAGCPVVVKIAPESPLTSFHLAEAIGAAGLPAGLVSFLPGRREALGDIVARPEFRHISFTGSSAAGRVVMKTAAEHLAGVTLELGGKSPALVLADLDPAEHVELLLGGMLGQQAGQTCTTYSRILVPREREQAWRDAIAELFRTRVVGDPTDPATDVGPLITAEHRDSVERYIRTAREEGATIIEGGVRPEGLDRGYYVRPTLIGDVRQDMTIVREEVFGPVITIQGYDSIEEGVALANDTAYGLAAGVFTNDEAAARELAGRLEAGAVGINMASACIFLPFGGYKDSGMGRDGGREGVEELLVTKQVQLRVVGA